VKLLFAVLLSLVVGLTLVPEPYASKIVPEWALNHVYAYAAGVLSMRGRARLWLCLGLAALGYVLELIQLKIPGRAFEWIDFFEDVAGIPAGYACAVLYARFIAPRFAQSPPSPPTSL